MSDPVYIRDGYTRRAKIKAHPGLYGEINFEYRPLLWEERESLEHFCAQNEPARYNPKIAALLAKHVSNWNVTDQGRPVKIDQEAVRRLPPMAKDYMLAIIKGNYAGDLPDNATPAETDEFLASLGGENTAEADAKNSHPASA